MNETLKAKKRADAKRAHLEAELKRALAKQDTAALKSLTRDALDVENSRRLLEYVAKTKPPQARNS
jgi:hypothetical protein